MSPLSCILRPLAGRFTVTAWKVVTWDPSPREGLWSRVGAGRVCARRARRYGFKWKGIGSEAYPGSCFPLDHGARRRTQARGPRFEALLGGLHLPDESLGLRPSQLGQKDLFHLRDVKEALTEVAAKQRQLDGLLEAQQPRSGVPRSLFLSWTGVSELLNPRRGDILLVGNAVPGGAA